MSPKQGSWHPRQEPWLRVSTHGRMSRNNSSLGCCNLDASTRLPEVRQRSRTFLDDCLRRKRLSLSVTSRQSLFLFVVHRGGSIFLHDKLAAPLARDLNLMCADLGTYLFKYPPSKASPYLASPRGRFYSKIYVPLFPFIRVPRGCRAACVIRDPRDVAVSTYYSLAYSHPLLPGESLENR